MASQEFTDFETRVVAEWLNDVNDHAYNEISTNIHPASAISFVPSGSLGSQNVQAAIEEAAASGGGGGASTLGELTDVNTIGATSGQVLKFNGSVWAPAADVTSGGAGTDADTLDGFDSSYFLNYNNLSNTPAIPNDLTDLGIADGSAGQVLTTNGSGVFSFQSIAGGSAGKVIGFSSSPNPTDTEVSHSSTAYATVASLVHTKVSATSRLVIEIGYHATATLPATNTTNAKGAIRINSGSDIELTRQKTTDAYDGATWTGTSNSAYGSYVYTGGSVGSNTIDFRVAGTVGGVGFRVKFYQIKVWEVEV